MDKIEPSRLSVQTLAGIGAHSASRLEKLGVKTLQDLLFHLPLRYQDRSRILPIAQLQPGIPALVCGKIDFIDTNQQRGRPSLICRISDASGALSLRFFHFSAQQTQQLKPGTLIGCFGELRYGYHGMEMVHPEYKLVQSAEQLTEATLTPVYPLTEGLSQTTLRKVIRQALTICLAEENPLLECLPTEILLRFHFPSLKQALQTLHLPSADFSTQALNDGSLPAVQRLAFEEFIAHHLALLQGKQAYKNWQAPIFNIDNECKQAFIERLPFQLTQAQQRVIEEIAQDCRQSQPMLRLIQGDVGCGKTIVAAVTALAATHTGYQVALMAPTELLAEQHFQNFSHWFVDSGFKVQILTGQLKGKTRISLLQDLVEGRIHILIGTHALFQESVQFYKLGLIIIDEQHRFGVNQRLALREKGQQMGLRPHQLIMTATPIPRTLAMLQYSDLDISIIDQLPPGRKPVITSVIPSERRVEVIDRIKHWVAEKKQAYWVCTLIEESEVLQCEAAEKTAIFLITSMPEVRVGLVHGRMKASEKDRVMQAFKAGDYDLLVATTVIEVGVDVVNAGLMIIENPERLGLSQLHQLRGRVGRGNQASFCLLLYQSPLSYISKQRLSILKASNDGFVIAEKDLALRGPGEVLGTRQTGQIVFKIADLNRDQALLDAVPEAAQLISQQMPEMIPTLLLRWLGANHKVEAGITQS